MLQHFPYFIGFKLIHILFILFLLFFYLNYLWRFLPPHLLGHNIFCNVSKSGNVNYTISKYLWIEDKSKICLTNFNFVQSHTPMHKFCACLYNILNELYPSLQNQENSSKEKYQSRRLSILEGYGGFLTRHNLSLIL